MQIQDQKTIAQVESAPELAYEAPKIETVLTPQLLEREVHYAGVVVVSGNNGVAL